MTMVVQRYKINDKAWVGLTSPTVEVMVPEPTGRYITYDDFITAISMISKSDPDLSPREAVLNWMYENFRE